MIRSLHFFMPLLLCFFSLAASAAIKTEIVEYKEGSTVLEGYLAYNDAIKNKAPGVIIVHEWMGLGEYSKSRARQMAELGYIAFAADIYGKGVRPKDAKEAGELAGKYKGDRKLLRARALAALDALKKNPKVDTSKILAMGYCFGGTTVLEMAMAGAPVKGVVSFHGGLDFPNLADVKNIKSKLLILHGAIDPYVPPEQVNSFTKALNDNKVDYQFTMYSGAVHSFTNPESGNDPSKGAAYNPVADRRSFEATKTFFREVTAQ
jgi:dienelactone hydrolase